MVTYDNKSALIPLGGGVTPDLKPTDLVVPRLDKVKELYDGQLIILPSGFVPQIDPIYDAKGHDVLLSRVGALYLTQGKNKIPYSRMRIATAHETIGEVYFSIKDFIQPLGIKDATFITSEIQMPRLEYTANWIFNLHNSNCNLNFESVENIGLNENELEARIIKENKRIESLKRKSKRITTVPDFINWFYVHHDLYSPKMNTQSIDDPVLAASYGQR